MKIASNHRKKYLSSAASNNETSQRPRIRYALAAWCCAQYEVRSEKVEVGGNAFAEQTQLIITRRNRSTQRLETYKTSRPGQYATNRMVRYAHIWCMLKSYA